MINSESYGCFFFIRVPFMFSVRVQNKTPLACHWEAALNTAYVLRIICGFENFFQTQIGFPSLSWGVSLNIGFYGGVSLFLSW